MSLVARESDVNPFLQGNFAPWRMEGLGEDLDVVGRLPFDLNGSYLRNGPNPAFEPCGHYHWFDGDGMIHAVTLSEGRAHYRNRYVLSQGLRDEREAGRALFPGLLDLGTARRPPGAKNPANGHVISHAGRLLALTDLGSATRLRPGTLETLGEYDFGGRLVGPMSSHPKIDPETGEMLAFGCSVFAPHLVHHVIDHHGSVIRSLPIDVAWPSLMHDFAITRGHVVFILCPLVFSLERLGERGGPFSWEPARGTRIGVMPRDGGSDDVRWLDTDACHVFHTVNAYEDGGTVVVDAARYARTDFLLTERATYDPSARDEKLARLHRWRIEPRGGGLTAEALDDASIEFPRIDERRLGGRHRFVYAAAHEPGEVHGTLRLFTAITRYDLERGTRTTRAFGAGNGVGEPIFVPRPGGVAEDDGWVLVLAYDLARQASDLLVLDARDVAGEPVARVRLPHRVPYGLHGSWLGARA